MAQSEPVSQSSFEVVDVTHSSPSVPTTSSFWELASHTSAANYNGLAPYTNETHNCRAKNTSNIAADTRIWIKSSGGGYAKSILEISNNFDKNTVFDVPGWDAADTESCYTDYAVSIYDGLDSVSMSFASASHGDLFTIYSVGKDYVPPDPLAAVTINMSSSRFVFVNGVLTKRNYEFDIMTTQSNCLSDDFPTLDLPDEQILFKRDAYGDDPVRAIMFISQSSQTYSVNRQFVSDQIDYCTANNLGFYYTNINLGGGNPTTNNKWMINGQTTDDATEMLVLALNHYCPWYSASREDTGSITLHTTQCPGSDGTTAYSGLIDNMGKTFFSNRKFVSHSAGLAGGWCANSRYEINTIPLKAGKGYMSASIADTEGGVRTYSYWYDWDHYNTIWNGTHIATNTEWDVPTSEVNYHSGIKESTHKDCGCGANSAVKPDIRSGVHSIHGSPTITSPNPYYNYDLDKSDIVELDNDVDSYMITSGAPLITKRPDCECNEIKGWKNTSLDNCNNGGYGNNSYNLTFSDGYTFTAGGLARLIVHNTTQRNNVSASGAGQEDSQWPYDIKIVSVWEIFDNATTYITSSHEYGFIKCADLYPGNSKRTGHVFLEKIIPIQGGNDEDFNDGQSFLPALDDSEFYLKRGGSSAAFDNLFGQTKQTHMTSFATSYPRSLAPNTIFSGCVMIENGLYVLFEDFCSTTITGCTDPSNTFYNWKATTDDGSCKYTFSNGNLFDKINTGSYAITPATWSSTVRGDEKIYNYDTAYDINLDATDVWGSSIVGNTYVSGNRFLHTSKSIFTTDGYSRPLFGHAFGGASKRLCGDSIPFSASVHEVGYSEANTMFVQDAANWMTDLDVKYTTTTQTGQVRSIVSISEETDEIAISGIEIVQSAFSFNNTVITLDSTASLRRAGIMTLDGGYLVKYFGLHYTGTVGVYTAVVESSSMTASYLATGTQVVSASGFWEVELDSAPIGNFTTQSSIEGEVGDHVYSNHIVDSKYFREIVRNRLSNTSPTKYSSSLYNSPNEDWAINHTGFQTGSTYPFTSAPTKSLYDWSYSNTSASNVSIDTGSASAGYHSFYTSALKGISYLDLSNDNLPIAPINSFSDLVPFTGLRYLKLTCPAIAPTVLDFTANTALEHLVIDGVGYLYELDVSTNKNLQTIEIIGSSPCATVSTQGYFGKLKLSNNCNLNSLSLINCLAASSNGSELDFSGAGILEDLTIIGGGLDEINIRNNKILKNITITDCPLVSLDTSCTGRALETLFLADTSVSELDLTMNSNLKALSVARTSISSALDLESCYSLKSLSYVSCSFPIFYQMSESKYFPKHLVDINISETSVASIDLGSQSDLETIIATDNWIMGIFGGGLTLPNSNSSKLKNLSIENSPNTLNAGPDYFLYNNSIEMLNISKTNASPLGTPTKFPTGLINMQSNDVVYWSSSVTFESCSKLQHVEIERCNLTDFALTDKTQTPAISPVRHVLAAQNELLAFPTASSTIEGLSGLTAYDPNIYSNFNLELLGCPYLQVLDLQDQTSSTVQGFTFLDLQKNRSLKILKANDNTELQAIRFVSHSILKLGLDDSFVTGSDLGSITIDLEGCTGFTTFIVNDVESSMSLMHLDSHGFINPAYNGTNWEIVIQ